MTTDTLEPTISWETMQQEEVPTILPEQLRAEVPIDAEAAAFVEQGRQQLFDHFEGRDGRLLFWGGPCAADDLLLPDGTPAIIRFGEELADLREEVSDVIDLWARLASDKPRTESGWKGMSEEPGGPARMREIMLAYAQMGIPVSSDIVNVKQLGKYGDLLSAFWVGTRAIDTPLKTHMSANPELGGFMKNGQDGTLKSAKSAIRAARTSHAGVDTFRVTHGKEVIVPNTVGNPHVGLMVRGGTEMKSPDDIDRVLSEAAGSDDIGLQRTMVDLAHGIGAIFDGGNKSVKGQLLAAAYVRGLIHGGVRPKGVMAEAYLVEGADSSPERQPGLSRTDPSMSIEQFKETVRAFADVLRAHD